MSTRKIMVDIETLGRKPGCVILEIGAVDFTEPQFEEFHVTINIETSITEGCTICADTLRWWMRQSDEAREVFNKEKDQEVSYRDAIGSFYRWINDRELKFGVDEIWANSTTFDLSILAAAIESFGKEKPWSYRAERCYRTARALSKTKADPFVGVPHCALSDARNQALHVIKMRKEWGI